MSSAFSSKVFRFLHLVNRHPDLESVDASVCLELSDYFTECDQDGRAFPSLKTIADAIGKSEATVIRSIRRVAATGLLRVIWGKPGRGCVTQYWMGDIPKTIRRKPASVKVKKPASAAAPPHRKPSNQPPKTFRAMKENHVEPPIDRPSSTTDSPLGVTDDALRGSSSPSPDQGFEEDEASEAIEGEVLPPDPERERFIADAVVAIGPGSRGLAIKLLDVMGGSVAAAQTKLAYIRAKVGDDKRAYTATIIHNEENRPPPPPPRRRESVYQRRQREMAAGVRPW